ncbi:MAG TPA: hypothetical protein DDY20_01535 [Desulfobulbaceae bacterium]|nr:hypothetical protein [Desulfobulbaceae bacterium]
MKKLYFAFVAAFFSFFFTSWAVAADGFSGSAYVSANSMYLWRGFDLSPDSDYVVQPGLDLSYAGFRVGIWANYDEDASEVNETDLTLEYSFEADNFSLAFGNVFYSLDEAEDTNEAYLSCTINTLLSPTLAIYYDWDQSNETGIYFTAGIGHSFELRENLSLNLGAMIGYNIENYSVSEEYSNFHNAELTASLDWALTDVVTFTPAVTLSHPLTNDAEDYAGIDDEAMVGLTVNFDF